MATKRTKKKSRGIYNAFATFPEHVYPFKTEINGRWVRGLASYDHALKAYQRRHGAERYGFKLATYRMFFHLLGSVVFIIAAAAISNTFFGSEISLYIIVVLAVLLISYQEFYYQPRRHMQRFRKGVLDWVTWVMPIVAYFWFHF